MAAPSNTHQHTDILDEDLFMPNGQNFALVSFVGPELRQKNDKFGMKIRGVFNTRDEADAHIRKIRRFDTYTDVFLVDLGKWLLVPPPQNPLELENADVSYDQKFLQDLIGGHKKNQELAKAHFEERKRAVMRDGLDAHLTKEERLPKPAEEEIQNPNAVFSKDDPWTRANPAPEKITEIVDVKELAPGEEAE
jgi:hypothetical protein